MDVVQRNNMILITGIVKYFDRLLNIESSEKEVAGIKKQATDKVEEVKKTMKRAGVLQGQVMRRTTTYYIGRAMGGINEK